MATENWREVEDTLGLYQVSDRGNVRRVFGRLPTLKPQKRLLKLSLSKVGYPRVTISIHGAQHLAYVHDLVTRAFLGPRPTDKPHVRHLNGDRTDNRLKNLRYGTIAENMQDRVLHGNDANGRKTHCPRGHEYPPFKPGGARPCHICVSARHKAKYWAKKRGETP